MKKMVSIFLALIISACGQIDSKEESKPNSTKKNQKQLAGSRKVDKGAVPPSLESIDKANNESVRASGDNITKASISSGDSSIYLTASMQQDHRIFGYSSPNTKSERLLLLSIFTNDVKNNPFQCELGAYYDTDGMENINLKYLETVGDFVKLQAINTVNKEKKTLYFERKWVEFEEGGKE